MNNVLNEVFVAWRGMQRHPRFALLATVALAALAAGVISSLVPGISIGDPVILLAVALLTFASAISASLVPARRLGGVRISHELSSE